METSTLHDRIRGVVGDRSYREIGNATKTHPETVRRYIQGQTPSAEFLTALCTAFSVNGEWLLTGTGPMRQAEVRLNALRQANPTELLQAVAQTLEKLIDRVERIEYFLHTMEARLQTSIASAAPLPSPFHGTKATPIIEGKPIEGIKGQSRAADIAGAIRPSDTTH